MLLLFFFLSFLFFSFCTLSSKEESLSLFFFRFFVLFSFFFLFTSPSNELHPLLSFVQLHFHQWNFFSKVYPIFFFLFYYFFLFIIFFFFSIRVGRAMVSSYPVAMQREMFLQMWWKRSGKTSKQQRRKSQKNDEHVENRRKSSVLLLLLLHCVRYEKRYILSSFVSSFSLTSLPLYFHHYHYRFFFFFFLFFFYFFVFVFFFFFLFFFFFSSLQPCIFFFFVIPSTQYVPQVITCYNVCNIAIIGIYMYIYTQYNYGLAFTFIIPIDNINNMVVYFFFSSCNSLLTIPTYSLAAKR